MRSLIWKGATAAIVVMASGAAAGQQIGPRPAILVTEAKQPFSVIRHVLSPTTVVDRVLSFDANGDGRIARDELPERMEGLVSRGDHNQDGFLAPDEAAALATTASTPRRFSRISVRMQSLAEVIADLKLPAALHDRAMGLVKQHPVSRNSPEPVGKELNAAMKQLLEAEDYENFVAAAARLRHTRNVVVGEVLRN